MRWLPKSIRIVFVFAWLSQASFSQVLWNAPDSLVKPRAVANGLAQGSLFASTQLGLQFAWYQEYQTKSFHFFNDWQGWMQMDKIGHAATAYQVSTTLYRFNRWSGVKEKNSIWWAAGLAYSYQLGVEIMDGFSEGWGFSNYDLLFNTLGSGGFVAQQLGWKEQRIKLKFSFWPSGLDQMNDYGSNFREVDRAEALYGKAIYEQWLKDYNGQTYWMSANLWSLTGKPDHLPKWINISLGYSVNNMLGAETNSWQLSDNSRYSSALTRERQLLLSLDLDLDHVPLPKRLIWIKSVVSVIKFPFPALEWNSERGLVGHPFYF